MNGRIAALVCPLDAQNVAAGCAGLGYASGFGIRRLAAWDEPTVRALAESIIEALGYMSQPYQKRKMSLVNYIQSTKPLKLCE